MLLRRLLSRRLVPLCAAAVAAIVVAGCSSSGNSSGGNSSSTTGAAASAASSAQSSAPAAAGGGSGQQSGSAASGTPIKVGIVCSCSGPFGSNTSRGEKVIEAWTSSVNASGGLSGHPIQLIEKDDASNPGTSVTAAQSLISSHVAVIIDTTVLDETWQKQVDAAKIPVIGGNFSTPMYYQDPNWYPTGQTNDSIVYSNVATAKASGGTKIGMLYCAESVQCQQSLAPTKADATKLGLSLTYQASVSATAPNYTAQCLAAKQAGVDSLIILDEVSVIAHIAEDCDRQGYEPTYVAEGTGYTNQVLGTTGLKDHYWAAYPVLPYFAHAPQVTAMNAVLDKYQPGMREDTDTWSVYGVQSWTAALALAQAVKASGVKANAEVTPADITKGLDTFSHETLGGWSPPLTFHAGKPHPVDCWYTGRVQGGQPSLTNNGKLTCQSGG